MSYFEDDKRAVENVRNDMRDLGVRIRQTADEMYARRAGAAMTPEYRRQLRQAIDAGETCSADLREAIDALDAAERRAAEAESLLSRAVKYAREDRMRTSRSTRLARVLAEAERALALASVATGPV